MNNSKKLWVVPNNDLEAIEIANLLRHYGEQVLVSQQAWGASWERLESEILQKIAHELSISPETQVYGVELSGAPYMGAINIDHHRWSEGDRSHEFSSIEQVAKLLQIKLNPYQVLVAINDKGWIPALIAAGTPQGVIDAIRLSDRAAQGTTPDDEAQAVSDIANAVRRGSKVLMETDKITSAQSDRLYGHCTELLRMASDKWIYTGPRHRAIFDAVQISGLGHSKDWMGGATNSGYCGFIAPSQGVQEMILKIFWEE